MRIGVPCALSIFVRLEIAQLFQPTLHTHPRTRVVKEAWTTVSGERLSVVLKRGPLIDLPRSTQLPAPLYENIETS
jgi:hypothetical protein